MVQLFRGTKRWVQHSLHSVFSSLLFYMDQKAPAYKNLVHHTLLCLMREAVELEVQINGSSRLSSPKENTAEREEEPKKEIIEQLFDCLSSPHQDLRSLSLHILQYYSKLRDIELRTILEPYSALFYERVNTKTIGCNLNGFLDCLLFVTGLFPELKLDSQFLSFLSMSLANNFGASQTPEAALLMIKGHFYLQQLDKTGDSINSVLEYICKYLVEPVYGDEAFIGYCRESVAKITNTSVLFSFSNRLARASFDKLKSERAGALSNLSFCLAVVRIFPVDFTDEMVGVCTGLLCDSPYEICAKTIKVLTYIPRMLKAERIAGFLRTFYGKVDRDLVAFFERHNYLLESLLACISDSNTVDIIKHLLGSKYVLGFFQTQVHRIKHLMAHSDYSVFVGAALLLSYLEYRFGDEELHHFISRYNASCHTEYIEFLETNFGVLKQEHINKIYTVVPNIVLSRKALSNFRFSSQGAGYAEAAKDSILRNLAIHGIPADISTRDDFVFESRMDCKSLASLLDSNLSFSEMAYSFRQHPTPDLFRKIALYNESSSRVLDVLRKARLEPENTESAILSFFNPDTPYKIHLVILIPLLIEKPSLITENILPRVVDSVHRLFGTMST